MLLQVLRRDEYMLAELGQHRVLGGGEGRGGRCSGAGEGRQKVDGSGRQCWDPSVMLDYIHVPGQPSHLCHHLI